MWNVNIPSYHNDPNYRYRMPRISTKVEGRGNGVKTNILNMSDIAKALKRNAEYCTRFCGCEVGALTKYNSTQGTAIVNGIHTSNDLQVVLDKFIEKFVLCPTCKLPEVDLFVDQNKVKGKCNACGFIGNMDNIHKVSTYICRNPPKENISTINKKSKNKNSSSKVIQNEESSNEFVEKLCNADVAIEETKKHSKIGKHEHKSHDKKERSNRKHDIEENIVNITKQLIQYYEEHKNFDNYNAEFKKLRSIYQVNSATKLYVFFLIVFRNEKMTVENLDKHLDSFKKLLDERFDRKNILKAFEMYGVREDESVFDIYGFICHWLYKNDIVDEFDFLERYQNYKELKETNDRDGNGKRRAAIGAADFITWLQQAESDSSEN